ncbi:muconolactone Delta-isomerase [Streptomyces sp. MMBL 11-1]|uniref:muconolactone Delta-isomerase n=1 Tax=Streptomyces sp. MMBL 11-1 TaxID=3026420 RepID=UPI0023608E1A|nr:muconolactone Delta-isomerase family protein [Streptomyces sp. MMBL 11-1]
MEFLVNIRITWPEAMDPGLKERVSDDERCRAAELATSGSLVRMWRVPGRTENWGLWRAADPTELHTIISSLPVWPWMDVTVHALADHPVDPGPTA